MYVVISFLGMTFLTYTHDTAVAFPHGRMLNYWSKGMPLP